MPLPAGGWFSLPVVASDLTPFPLPEPLVATYRWGEGDVERTADINSISLLNGGGAVDVTAGYNALGQPLIIVELRMEEAYGVAMLDCVQVFAGIEACSVPGAQPWASCAVPDSVPWSACD